MLVGIFEPPWGESFRKQQDADGNNTPLSQSCGKTGKGVRIFRQNHCDLVFLCLRDDFQIVDDDWPPILGCGALSSSKDRNSAAARIACGRLYGCTRKF